ncbi:MAG: dynamin family protein [Acidimicrobiales bacterium]
MTASDQNAEVRAVLELSIKAATAYGRPDLAERLRAVLERVRRPDVQIVAVGEFKQGKSSLVNALVNVNICPVDDDIATAVHTIVRHGEEKRAFALIKSAADPDGEGERMEIALDQIRAYATELGGVNPSIVVKGVEIEIPRKLLADGVILIDTPGVGGLGSAHAAAGLGALSIADAALFISDASQEYTRAEMDFLAQAVELCPSVICVMTKIDLYARWRDVLSINQGHLARLGLSRPILPVSSMLRVEAVRRKDKDINQQSGFPALVQYITNDLVASNAQRDRETARQDVLSVTDQLSSGFDAERRALDDPGASARLVGGLEQAKARAGELRGQLSRWNTTLNDGIADLTSDVDFDLRGRIRAILAEADKSIDSFDPAESWDEFSPWLQSTMSQAVVANYRYLTERTSALSRDVQRHFDSDGAQLMADLEIHDAAKAMARVRLDHDLDLDVPGAGSRGLTALRGSFSGFLMVSLLAGLVPVALPIVPLGLGAGLLLGRKTVRDERERVLARRRADAKSVVRRYCDEVSFQIGKDSRDTLRLIQRQLRDRYGTLAEELGKSTSEALRSATEAAKVAEADRAKRLRDAKAELERIDALRQRALKLAPATAGRGVGAR